MGSLEKETVSHFLVYTFDHQSLNSEVWSPIRIQKMCRVHPSHNLDGFGLAIHQELDPKDFRAFPK